MRKLARELAAGVRRNAQLDNVHLDWDEPSKVVRMRLDQDRARLLGISSEALADFLQSSVTGQRISQFSIRSNNTYTLYTTYRHTCTWIDRMGIFFTINHYKFYVITRGSNGPITNFQF